MVAVAPAASVPNVQLTALDPIPVQVPADILMASAVNAAGSKLLSVELALLEGPRFETVTV